MLREAEDHDNDDNHTYVDDVSLIDPSKRKKGSNGSRSGRTDMQMGRNINVNPYGMTVLAVCVLGFIYLVFGSTFFFSSKSNMAVVHGGRGVATGRTVSLRQVLAAAVEAAKRGGREVKRVRDEADIGEASKGKTREGANNPVTNGDMLSHQAMYYSLKSTFPGMHVVSEEHDNSAVDNVKLLPLNDPEVDRIITADEEVNVADIDVWIDPLDATQEYTEKLLHFVTTMVCVAVKGVPVLGVIHKPFSNETAWGFAGNNNKYVNDKVSADARGALQVNNDLTKSRIIVSRSHAGDVKDVAKNALGEFTEVTPAGGAGYKSWEVIKGEQDAYVHVTLIKKWDICAGDAILRALGGQLTDLSGKTIDYEGEEPKNEGGVLATMHHHSEYLAALKDAVKH